MGYILSDDGGITNPTLKGTERTNRDNKVCRDRTDESSNFEGLNSDKYTKARNVEPNQMGGLKGGVVLRGYAHNKMRMGKCGEETVVKVAECGEG